MGRLINSKHIWIVLNDQFKLDKQQIPREGFPVVLDITANDTLFGRKSLSGILTKVSQGWTRNYIAIFVHMILTIVLNTTLILANRYMQKNYLAFHWARICIVSNINRFGVPMIILD